MTFLQDVSITQTMSVNFTAGDIQRHKHFQQGVSISQGHLLILNRSSYLVTDINKTLRFARGKLSQF